MREGFVMDSSELEDIKLKEQLASDTGFGVYRVADFMGMSFKPKEPLIDGIMNIGETVIVCGTPKAGKSIFLQSLAYALSSGEDKFLGALHIAKPCKVCYVQLEGELADTHDRFRRIGEGVKHDLDNMALFFSEPMKLDDLAYTLDVMFKIEQVMTPDVLIIDPLYMSFSGSLSDDEVIRKVLANLRIMKMHFKCTLIIAHHTHKLKRNEQGKEVIEGDEAMFGSQFLKAYPDHVLMLNYDVRNGTRTLTCMTQRSGNVEKEIKLKLNEPSPLFFEEFEEYPKGIVLDFTKKRILELISAHSYPLKAKEIYGKLSIPRTTFHRVIKDLQKEGKVFAFGEGQKITYFNQEIEKKHENNCTT
jgi:hypothetical protein